MVDETNEINTATAIMPDTADAENVGTGQTPSKSQSEASARLRDAFGKFQKGDVQPDKTETANQDKTDADQVDQEAEKQKDTSDSEPEKQAESESDDTPKFSTRQLEVAKQLSIDPEDLADLTPAQLLEFVGRKYNQGMSKLGRQLQEARDARGNKAEPVQSKDEKPELQVDFAYDENDYDSLGNDGVTGKHNRHLDITKTLMTRVSELEAYIQDRKDSELASEADRFFAGLDKDTFPDFGDKSASELAEDSQELENRKQIVEDAQALQDAYSFRGRSISLAKALEKALYDIYSDNIRTAERRNIAKKVDDRRKSAGTRPTARTSKPTEASTLQQKMQEIARVAKEKLGVNWG